MGERRAPVVRVVGDSMEPTLRAGDLAHYVESHTLRVGDIGVFDVGAGRLVIHRVLSTRTRREMGDNRSSARHFATDEVVGRVVAIDRGAGPVDLTTPTRRAGDLWWVARGIARLAVRRVVHSRRLAGSLPI